jgi:hypothetical protein
VTRPPYTIGWYNGWSPDERLATVPIQKAAIASGALPRPRICSICRAHWSRENPVWLHDENYADPLAAYPICRRCHRTLHQRFDYPEPWRALVEQHGNNTHWFEQLSMDPASQRRPFDETYPDGLSAST